MVLRSLEVWSGEGVVFRRVQGLELGVREVVKAADSHIHRCSRL